MAEGPAPHLLRCMTHLVLVLRKIYRIVEPKHERVLNDVLVACVKVLIIDAERFLQHLLSERLRLSA